MAKRINISGQIVSREDKSFYERWGYPTTSPEDIVNALSDCNNEDIEIYINSPGGSVVDASEIYTAIKEYKGDVTAKIIGLAASAASWIAMAANKVLISPTGLMMVHNSSSIAWGDYTDMDASSNMLQTIDSAIRNAYKLKTGLEDEALKDFMDSETWMNAQDAVNNKFADEILFDKDSILSPINIVNSLILPQQKVDGIKNINFEREGNTLGVETKNEEVEKTQQNTNEQLLNEKLTVECVKNDYPSIYQAIYNAGVEYERGRIQGIDELSVSGVEDLVNEAKYVTPISPEKLAVNIIKAQKEQGKTFVDNLKADKENVHVDNSEVERKTHVDEKEDFINNFKSAIERKVGK